MWCQQCFQREAMHGLEHLHCRARAKIQMGNTPDVSVFCLLWHPSLCRPPCIAGIVAEISAPPDFLSFTEMETGSMHYPVQFSALLYTPLQRGQQGRKMEPWTQSTTQCSSRFSSVPRSPHVKGFGNAIPDKKYVDSSASAASINKEKSEGCQTYLLGTALSTLFWDMALPWRGLVEWCDRS